MTNGWKRWAVAPKSCGFATWIAGCSGTTSASDAGSTSPGSGGAASSDSGTTGTSGSGGGTASLPAPRGATSFAITTCQQYTAGVALDGNVPTSQGSPGDRLTDGEDGVSVSCRVAGGPPFEISGSLRGVNNHPAATFAGDPIELRIESGTITETGLGTADMSLFAGSTFQSQTANPCTLSVVAAPSLEVASGRIFAAFTCNANLDVAASPIVDCSATGVVVFERCME